MQQFHRLLDQLGLSEDGPNNHQQYSVKTLTHSSKGGHYSTQKTNTAHYCTTPILAPWRMESDMENNKKLRALLSSPTTIKHVMGNLPEFTRSNCFRSKQIRCGGPMFPMWQDCLIDAYALKFAQLSKDQFTNRKLVRLLRRFSQRSQSDCRKDSAEHRDATRKENFRHSLLVSLQDNALSLALTFNRTVPRTCKV